MIERFPERIGIPCVCGDDWNAHHFHDEERKTCVGSMGCSKCPCGGYYSDKISCEKRIPWSDGGRWCNICIERPAVTVGLCDICKLIPNPGCQLCLSKVPRKLVETASGHMISWGEEHWKWIPCTPDDRKKIIGFEGLLHGELTYACARCYRSCKAWANESGMCQDCFDKCQSCGGTGLLPFHPRLGLSTYCSCKYGQEKRAATPLRDHK